MRRDLDERNITADIIRLDGAVEISIQLGVADAIADVVGSGQDIASTWFSAFGDVLCDSEAVLVRRADAELSKSAKQFVARVQGVVFGQQYVMIDYDCPRELFGQGRGDHPGIESPTVSPMADDKWVAVRALVPGAAASTRT